MIRMEDSEGSGLCCWNGVFRFWYSFFSLCVFIELFKHANNGVFRSIQYIPKNSKWLQENLTGVPWTEEEHRTFPVGFEKLGKGDWRGISRNYVTSRTPTQVASHAQKYFIRLATMNKKKRRSSLFDMVGNGITNPISSSNCKSSKCEIEDDVTLSLVQLQDTKLDEQKDSDKYCEAGPAGAEHEAVPLWLHPQMKSSNNNVAAVVPDLELTLAVSKGKAKTLLGLEQTQTKSSPDSFLLGPISVT
ncbi:Transcription factor MYB1R1 [Glycine soja]|uniref:Transcription factor MYB1R1 n=1 Tax=Glycine soja TaxID=3848 RepID=A0A0B2P2L8_GLYSO|nr:Transcription factor MYB1R1 [Glycine soja]